MSAPNEPPHLPDVVDEAGQTPVWVPLLGLALLCLAALTIAAREAIGHKDDKAAAAAADAGAAEAKAAEKQK